MCYICGKSENKIVHRGSCRYVKMIPKKNRKYYHHLDEAIEGGYQQCKYCSPMYRYMRKEKDSVALFCKENGLFYSFNRQDGSLDVVSRTGEWKIIVNGQRHHIFLYHKNINRRERRSLVPGYHSQNVRRNTLMAYLRYIVEHDIYRKEQPLFESQMGGTGRKARKEQKKLAKKVKKWQSIRYVNKLIDQMSMGAIAYG